MDQTKMHQTSMSWARIGGISGLVIIFFLFGFGKDSGAQGILLAGLRGFVGAGLGAGIFYCIAGLIYSPEASLKLFNLVVIIFLSIIAVFLLYTFSAKFNELLGNNVAHVAAVQGVSEIRNEPIAANHPKEIVVRVTRDGQGLSMSTNNLPKAHTEDKIINTAKIIFDHNHEFEVLIHAVNISDEDAMKAIHKFNAAGIENVRKITNEDWLRLQDKWDKKMGVTPESQRIIRFNDKLEKIEAVEK